MDNSVEIITYCSSCNQRIKVRAECYRDEEIIAALEAAGAKLGPDKAVCYLACLEAKKYSKFEKITDYIPFFETATSQNSCSYVYPFCLGVGIEYCSQFRSFINHCYDYEIMHSYNSKMSEYIRASTNEQILQLINKCGISGLLSVLDAIIRAERCCDGAWASFIDDKIFLAILNRLKEKGFDK